MSYNVVVSACEKMRKEHDPIKDLSKFNRVKGLELVKCCTVPAVAGKLCILLRDITTRSDCVALGPPASLATRN